MLKLFDQNDRVTCAACSYATLLSGLGIKITEAQACDEVKTKKSGTIDYNILEALQTRKIESNLIRINQSFSEYGRWLYLNSLNRFVIVSCNFISQGKRGRPAKDCHAVCISDGMVYDSAENAIIPLETYTFKHNKEFEILSMIIVDNPNFKKRIDIC
jgi:hypothetical protein